MNSDDIRLNPENWYTGTVADMPIVAFNSGARLVIINQGETPLDRLAHLRFWEDIGMVFPPAVNQLKELMKI